MYKIVLFNEKKKYLIEKKDFSLTWNIICCERWLLRKH